jgi:hypothetical protein
MRLQSGSKWISKLCREKVASLIDDLWRGHLSTGVEHALVVLKNGERAIVRGGADGIEFAPNQIRRLITHTHANELGSSRWDREAIAALQQTRSYIVELTNPGSWKLFRP